MAEIVDTTGRRIEEGEPLPSKVPLDVLKQFVATAERCDLPLTKVYLLVEVENAGPISGVWRKSYDSGLTAEEAVLMLEMEKFQILAAMRGKSS